MKTPTKTSVKAPTKTSVKAPTKTFRVDIKLRNNQIVSRREALGISCPELSERVGIPYQYVVEYENFRRSPILLSTNEWSNNAKRLASFFNVLPEDIWPSEALLVEKSKTSTTLDIGDVQALLGTALPELPASPEAHLLLKEQSADLQEAFSLLRPRERDFLVKRALDGKSFEELDPRISRERARQIYEQATAHMRRFLLHPESRKSFLDIQQESDDFRKGHRLWTQNELNLLGPYLINQSDNTAAARMAQRELGDRSLQAIALKIKQLRKVRGWAFTQTSASSGFWAFSFERPRLWVRVTTAPLRRAVARDKDLLLRLSSSEDDSHFRMAIKRHKSLPRATVYFATLDEVGLTVGIAMRIVEKNIVRFGVFVDPYYRRQGIATQLYQKAYDGTYMHVAPREDDDGAGAAFFRKMEVLV